MHKKLMLDQLHSGVDMGIAYLKDNEWISGKGYTLGAVAKEDYMQGR